MSLLSLLSLLSLCPFCGGHLRSTVLPNDLKLIALLVLLLHVTLIISATWNYKAPLPKAKRQLLVKTVQLKDEKIVPISKKPVEKKQDVAVLPLPIEPKIGKEQPAKSTKASSKPKPAIKKKEKPKKAEPKKATKSISEKKQKVSTSVDDKEKNRKSALLKAAQESISKIAHTHAKLPTNPMTPMLEPVTTLNSELNSTFLETWSAQEQSYYDELASRLQLLLRLPEFGQVRIKLTLASTGKFIAVKVVSSKSSKNSAYIEKTLPTLTYPGFGSHFENAPEYTFAISLNNSL